ncbi:hypothetical protein [Marinilactibacillus sp. Marseille-P9653]|uniref:hypothetical protein n=1 Tax=Marinilactibacillus sp. Marseille-P9653 TaxID=2866583 RepID=UPI001CE47C19|nr:hypothetical protein [Marinilactibacillus sp. Marseille-P9653]
MKRNMLKTLMLTFLIGLLFTSLNLDVIPNNGGKLPPLPLQAVNSTVNLKV